MVVAVGGVVLAKHGCGYAVLEEARGSEGERGRADFAPARLVLW